MLFTNDPAKTLRRTLATALSVATLTLQAAPAGTGNAGLMDWSFEYHNTQVPVAIWHPTSAKASSIDAGPFTLQAAAGGEIEQTQHPLVIVSHGTGGSSIAHHPLAEALARAGYLVAALTHPGDNYQDRSLVEDERYFSERPRQVGAMLHALMADPALGELIDPARIGAIGHSAGGFSIAASIGARPDREQLLRHCQATTADPSCQYKDATIGVTSPSDDRFALPVNADTTTSTARIRSAVLLAPLGSVLSENALIDKSTPLLIVTAELDEILPHQYHLERLQKVAPHAQTQMIAGAGHFSFIAPVNQAWRAELGEVAIDPPGFNRARFNEKLGRDLVDWFNNTISR